MLEWQAGMNMKQSKIKPELQEIAATALSEHGFLLAQAAKEEIKRGYLGSEHKWRTDKTEYPVTALDGHQTRVDLVLRHQDCEGVRLSLECKRANPSYKWWLFFDSSPSAGESRSNTVFLDTMTVTKPQKHRGIALRKVVNISADSADWKCFNYYIEAKVERNGRASSTATIEEAFTQVMFGQTGLFTKATEEAGDSGFLTVIPVIVTTAQLYQAEFESANVVLAEGTIASSDIRLNHCDFLAVNYHPSDSLCLGSLGDMNKTSRFHLEADLKWWHVRTIFVVNAAKIASFLPHMGEWLDKNELLKR